MLVKTHDGFEIAQRDLELRGQGELTGMRQAGAGELDFLEILREPELLEKARQGAERLIASDPELSSPQHLKLRQMMASFVWGRD